eukprot:126045-Rhodomonas_salina.7
MLSMLRAWHAVVRFAGAVAQEMVMSHAKLKVGAPCLQEPARCQAREPTKHAVTDNDMWK